MLFNQILKFQLAYTFHILTHSMCVYLFPRWVSYSWYHWDLHRSCR